MKKSLLAIICLPFISAGLQASVWIDAQDIHLRHHIQRLSDAGVLTAPTITYPLMWSALHSDLHSTTAELIPAHLRSSFLIVLHYYRQAKNNNFNNQVKLSATNSPNLINGMGSSAKEKASLQLSSEYMGASWAAKISTQLRHKPEDQHTLTFDDSYLAKIYGNWMFRVGAVSQWWGPGWDSSLILSDNARPLPALSITRSNSNAFESPWLSWIGPWNFTAQMAKLENNRHIPNALLWSTRGTFRPLPSLQIGASWSIQWGGDEQPNSIQDFWRALSSEAICVNGEASCDSSQHTKLGNQLAGIDMRWSFSIADIPFALYGQTIGEDAVNYIKPADKAYNFGAETEIMFGEHFTKVFIEYTETQVACGTNPDHWNCYYEHGTYHTGYRYHGRSLGTTFDNDAKAWSLGTLTEFQNNQQLKLVLRVAELNADNSDRAVDSSLIGNQVSKTAQDLLQLEANYQFVVFDGQLSLNSQLSQFKATDNTQSTDINLSISWDLRY